MILFPNAKINLGLNIVSKRSDGYHDIVSCLYPIGWQDVLEVIEGDRKTELKISGLEVAGAEKENLVLRAYELLRKDYDLPPVKIHLHKIIPMGAGLGGGSADAAAMLAALNEMYQLFLDDSLLEEYAAKLGSDCPFFIKNKPQLALERGDVFAATSVDLSNYFVQVVKPPVHIATAQAYAGITPQKPETTIKEILEEQPIESWKELLHNDFEDSLFPKYPEIKELKELLYSRGAIYASMSGSGSAVYGLFKHLPEAPDVPDTYLQWVGKL